MFVAYRIEAELEEIVDFSLGLDSLRSRVESAYGDDMIGEWCQLGDVIVRDGKTYRYRIADWN